MKKNNLMQHFFCARKIIKIIPTLLIAVLLLTLTYFTPGIKSIFGQDNSKILICIDPGHGGKDHGATGPTGLKEKDVNLDISFKLRDKLAGSGFAVIMTREDDTKKSLDDIVNIANASNADIFISVHNNSHTLREKNGTETFYFSQSPGSYFLASYVNTRTIEQIGTLNRGVKSANFKELRNTKMTSALVEGAFISNPDEEAKLNDPGFRERIAEGIYNGIVEYLNKNGESVLINKKISSAQSFIRRVYQKSLNLDPDQATLDNLANKLAAGTISHADVIKGVILSKQFKDLNLSETQFINVLYGAVLDRNPDPAGEAHWLKQLKILDRTAVLNYFLTSAEFNGLVSQYIRYGYSYSGLVNSDKAGKTTGGATIPESGTGLVLSVLNGVGIKGIAARTSDLFKDLKDSEGNNKYIIYKVIDASSYNYKNTQIICKFEDPEILKAAEEIKTVLKTGIITTQKGSGQVSDIVIIIGSDYSPDNSNLVLVNILNGHGTQGIAARVKSLIEKELNKSSTVIKVTETKNADSFNYKNSKIIVFSDKAGINNIADNIKKLLGTGEIITTSGSNYNVDITVILGSDYNK